MLIALLLAVSLTRGPYLGRSDDHSMTIVWRTDAAADSVVSYGLMDGDMDTVRDGAPVTTHKIRVDRLIPGAMYRYAVASAGVHLGSGTFRAPRAPDDDSFTFAVIGDTNRRWIPEIIGAALADEAPDFLLHTGDVVYPNGSDELYDEEFFKPLARILRIAPAMPLFGDHDMRTDRGAPLLDNFVTPDSGTSGGRRFYSFRHGDALFVAVDVETSSFGKGSPQYNWLVRQLSTTDATWKFVYLHEPPYSSDRSSGMTRIILTPLFERYGVDMAFSGNSHLYERTNPICAFGYPQCRGVTYITEGGGGAEFSEFVRQKFTAFVLKRHGYTMVRIEGRRLTLTSHDMDRRVVDSIVITK